MTEYQASKVTNKMDETLIFYLNEGKMKSDLSKEKMFDLCVDNTVGFCQNCSSVI